MRRIVALIFSLEIVLSCPDDPLCRSCSNNVCDICNDSHFFDNSCRPVDIEIPHCEKYPNNPTKNECLECVLGYRLVKLNECERCTDSRCAICTMKKNYCTACFDGLFPENGICGQSDSKDPYCVVPTPTQGCQLCVPTHAISPDLSCRPGPFNCLKVNNRGQCLVCRNGAYISSSGHCEGEPKPIPDFDHPWLLYIMFVMGTPVAIALIYFFFNTAQIQKDREERYRAI